ncbi:MAG: helix-turn-helix transcriptional regulator [bacterium]
MASRKLPNYLRTYRKITGFSQDEVAFLMGSESGTQVSRYERGARKPSIETAFAYELIFGALARDLLAGVFEKVEEKIARRAPALTRKLSTEKSGIVKARKLALLERISSRAVATNES